MQTTINISLDVPQSYQLDTLKQELTEYAKKLVAKAKLRQRPKNSIMLLKLCVDSPKQMQRTKNC